MLRIVELEDRIRIDVRVQPRSSKNQILGEYEGALKIKLMAPPVDGEANSALVNFLSGFFQIPKRNVNLLKGETSKNKIVELIGINKQDFLRKTGL